MSSELGDLKGLKLKPTILPAVAPLFLTPTDCQLVLFHPMIYSSLKIVLWLIIYGLANLYVFLQQIFKFISFFIDGWNSWLSGHPESQKFVIKLGWHQLLKSFSSLKKIMPWSFLGIYDRQATCLLTISCWKASFRLSIHYFHFLFLLVIRCIMARFASTVVNNCVFYLRMPEFLRIKKWQVPR